MGERREEVDHNIKGKAKNGDCFQLLYIYHLCRHRLFAETTELLIGNGIASQKLSNGG